MAKQVVERVTFQFLIKGYYTVLVELDGANTIPFQFLIKGYKNPVLRARGHLRKLSIPH